MISLQDKLYDGLVIGYYDTFLKNDIYIKLHRNNVSYVAIVWSKVAQRWKDEIRIPLPLYYNDRIEHLLEELYSQGAERIRFIEYDDFRPA